MDEPNSEHDLKRYFKEIKSLLPVYSKEEKKFLDNLRSDVNSFIEENPDNDYSKFTSYFGEPKDIVSRYIADADSTYLIKRIKNARHIKIGITVSVVTILLAALIFISLIYADIVKGQKSYIDRQVTVITEE